MRGAAECVTDVATTFWRFFVIFSLYKTTATLNLIVTSFMCLSSNSLQVRTDQTACILQLIINTEWTQEKWKLFVLYTKVAKAVDSDVNFASILQ